MENRLGSLRNIQTAFHIFHHTFRLTVQFLTATNIQLEKTCAYLLAKERTGNRGTIHWPSCRSEEHTSELQSLMRISYAVFCLKKKKQKTTNMSTKILSLNLKYDHN